MLKCNDGRYDCAGSILRAREKFLVLYTGEKSSARFFSKTSRSGNELFSTFLKVN